jgi:hypothetical protein
MTKTETTPAIDHTNTPRTWRFYCDHEVRYSRYEKTNNGVRYEHRVKGENDRRLTCQTKHQKVLDSVGTFVDLDSEPDLETFKVLWEVQKQWCKGNKKYTPGVTGYDVRQCMTSLFEDHNYVIDPEIFRWFFTKEIHTEEIPTKKNGLDGYAYPMAGMVSHLSKHPHLPTDVIEYLIKLPKEKDPTTCLKGGRIYTFMTSNNALTGSQLLRITKVATRVGDQRDCLTHPNVTKDVIEYLINNGKSDTLINETLRVGWNRGLLKI